MEDPEGGALLTGLASEDTPPETEAGDEAAGTEDIGTDEDGPSGTVMKVTEQEPAGALPLGTAADDAATEDGAPDEAGTENTAPDEAAAEEDPAEEAIADPEGTLEGMATTVDTPSATEEAGGADADPGGADPAGADADAGCDGAGAEALAKPEPPLLA